MYRGLERKNGNGAPNHRFSALDTDATLEKFIITVGGGVTTLNPKP